MFRYWFRVAYLTVLVGACGLAFVTSDWFENRFAYQEGELRPIGDSGFNYAWVSEDAESKLDCETFDWCAHIKLSRAGECKTRVIINVELVNINDKYVSSEQVYTKVGSLAKPQTVEIGVSGFDDFEWFRVDNIKCEGETQSGSANL